MKTIDPLFKYIFNKKLYGGSYYDGLKLYEPDEYDLDLAFKLPKKADFHLDTSSEPGFVRIYCNLDSLKQDVNLTREIRFVTNFSFINFFLNKTMTQF